MQKSQVTLQQSYIELVGRHLGTRKNIARAIAYSELVPEVVDIHIGELQAVLRLLERYSRLESIRSTRLYPNTENLIRILGEKSLPQWTEVQLKLTPPLSKAQAREFEMIFEEVGTFEFPDMELPELSSPVLVLGTLFVSFYRTYALVTQPYLREQGAMVGSTLAEMLAWLAFYGCKTHLFDAEKIWILYPDPDHTDAFSMELISKVRSET